MWKEWCVWSTSPQLATSLPMELGPKTEKDLVQIRRDYDILVENDYWIIFKTKREEFGGQTIWIWLKEAS